MMNPRNTVSAVISGEDQEKALGLIAEVRALLPLISLSKEQRKSLAKVDEQTLAASLDVATAAERFPGLVPAELCDAEEMRRDHALAEALVPVEEALQSLLDSVKSTRLGARSDVVRASSVGYGVLYAVRHTREGLGALVERLRDIFAKRGNRNTDAQPPAAAQPPADAP